MLAESRSSGKAGKVLDKNAIKHMALLLLCMQCAATAYSVSIAVVSRLNSGLKADG